MAIGRINHIATAPRGATGGRNEPQAMAPGPRTGRQLPVLPHEEAPAMQMRPERMRTFTSWRPAHPGRCAAGTESRCGSRKTASIRCQMPVGRAERGAERSRHRRDAGGGGFVPPRGGHLRSAKLGSSSMARWRSARAASERPAASCCRARCQKASATVTSIRRARSKSAMALS